MPAYLFLPARHALGLLKPGVFFESSPRIIPREGNKKPGTSAQEAPLKPTSGIENFENCTHSTPAIIVGQSLSFPECRDQTSNARNSMTT